MLKRFRCVHFFYFKNDNNPHLFPEEIKWSVLLGSKSKTSGEKGVRISWVDSTLFVSREEINNKIMVGGLVYI